MIEISTLIAFFATIIVALPFVNWFFNLASEANTIENTKSPDKFAISKYRLYDNVVLALIIFFVLGRIFGLVYNPEQINGIGFSFLPASQPDEEIRWLSNWPWIFFRFTDGLFMFIEPISAFVISTFILRFFHGKDFSLFSKQIITSFSAYLLSIILFTFVLIYNNHLSVEFLPSLGLYSVLLIVFSFSLSRIANVSIILIWQAISIIMSIIFLEIASTPVAKDTNYVIASYFVFFVLAIFNIVAFYISYNKGNQDKSFNSNIKFYEGRRKNLYRNYSK